MAKHARISPRARRRGITIAAGALTVSMVSPFVQSVVAPNSVTQATAQESEYVPANVGQPFSDETEGILRYANAQNQPEFNSTTGADAMITLSHWWQASASRGSVFGTNTSNPDGGMLFLNFRDPAFYEAIDHIDIVGQSGDPADIQASMYKRDPAGSEWQVALKDYSFVGIGTDYQSNALIYLKDGVNINSLPKPDLGFYVDSYYTTYDGKVARESVSSTTITGDLFWQSADGFPDEIITDPASIANWLRTQARKGVRYDQANNSITSTTTFTPRENFLQASFSWSAVFRENIDKAIVPFVESVEIYSSDMYGNQRSGSKSFSLYLDPATGQVTSERNTDISWKAGEEITAQTYSKVRSNQDDIFYGTLGQTRSFTIKYHLKPGSATDLQETTSQQLINAASGDVYFDVQTWLEADFADKWVWGVAGPTDGGADSMAVPLSYTHSYVNVVDSDGDGLTDEYEAQIGSDSSNPDTDGDGVPDGQEQLIDKTEPLDAKSYLPTGPTSERTRVIAAKLNEVSGTAPKVEYPNPLAEGTNLEVTNTDPIPTRVYLVPVNAVSMDASGRLQADTGRAIASDTYANLDELMAGSFTLTPTSNPATPGEYTLVAVSPAGEVTRGSNITISDPQTDDFDLTIDGVDAVPLEPASTDPAEFTENGAAADAPAGVTYEILPKDGYTVVTDGVAAEPGEVSIADNGAVTFVPRAEDANTSVTFQVRAMYEDLSEDLVDATFTVGNARDTDGDGIPDYQDPDQGGETTDWRTLTHGVRVDGQVINSDGVAGADELPETLRGLTVTLSNGADSATSGGADAWRGAQNYPLVKNFDLYQFGLGDYTATIGGADAWAETYVLLPSGLNSGQPLTVTGETGTQYVNFETKQTTTYTSPDAPLARATTATPTFGNGTTDSTRKNTDSTFKLGALPEGYSIPADGAVASKPGEVSINAETGAVTFVPRVEDIGEDVVIPVTTVFVDGTEAESTVTFKVGDGQTADLDPSYGAVEAVPTKPSTTNLILEPGQSLPTDTTFEGELAGYSQVDADPEPGQFTINEQGNVTLVPRLEDADKPLTLVVTLTYPDGSGDTADAVFNVGQDLAGIIEPSYEPTPANPARRVTSPLILGEDQVLPS